MCHSSSGTALFVLIILIFKGKLIGIFKLHVDDIMTFYFLSRFFDAVFVKDRCVT